MNYRKLADKMLFAPSRIMDDQGDNPYKGWVPNFFAAPQVKVGVLSAFFAGAALAATSDKDKAAFLVLPVVGAYFLGVDKYLRKKPVKFYYDAEPDTKRPIPTLAILNDLKKRRNSFSKNMAFESGYALIATSVVYPFLPTNLIIPAIGYIYASKLTQRFATSWRADQALRGDWNVLATKPPEEKRETALKTSIAAPSPS